MPCCASPRSDSTSGDGDAVVARELARPEDDVGRGALRQVVELERAHEGAAAPRPCAPARRATGAAVCSSAQSGSVASARPISSSFRVAAPRGQPGRASAAARSGQLAEVRRRSPPRRSRPAGAPRQDPPASEQRGRYSRTLDAVQTTTGTWWSRPKSSSARSPSSKSSSANARWAAVRNGPARIGSGFSRSSLASPNRRRSVFDRRSRAFEGSTMPSRLGFLISLWPT